MHQNHRRFAMAVILTAAVITVLLGSGRGSSEAHRATAGDNLHSGLEPTWTLVDPQGDALSLREDQDWISRARTTALDIDGFRDHLLAEADHAVIEVPLFDESTFFARTHRLDVPDENQLTWVARLEGIEGGHMIVGMTDGVVFGMVNAPGYGLYEFHPAPIDGDEQRDRDAGEAVTYVVHEIDATRLPGCGVGPEHCVRPREQARPAGLGERWRRRGAMDFGPVLRGEDSPGGSEEPMSGETPVVRVLVAYTPAARSAVGGNAAMNSLINSTIAQTNLAFENSLIDLHAELAHSHEVGYQQSGNIGLDLNRLTGVDNGFMDEVHELRAIHQADLVALLVSYSSGACGVAWCMTTPSINFAYDAFSVTRTQCISNLTFPHELGHNMGCHHDHNNTGGACGTYNYSFGHRFVGNSGNTFRTVLAYQPGQRITYFSNPDVLFDGQPTGVPVGQFQEAHNAQTINLNAPIVTSFAELFPPPFPPENDTCAERIVVTDGVTEFNSDFATTDGPDEPELCNFFSNPQIEHDVWFEYDATCTGEVTVSLCSSSFAPKLGIYTGGSCPTEPGVVSACDILSCPDIAYPKITMPVEEGDSLIIRVGGRTDQTGDGVIDITCEEVDDPGIPGDLTGNGVVDGEDLLLLLSAWGECADCESCPADLTGDCTVDGADLLILLQNWG